MRNWRNVIEISESSANINWEGATPKRWQIKHHLVGGLTTHFKNIVQIGSFPQFRGVKIKNLWNHHLVKKTPGGNFLILRRNPSNAELSDALTDSSIKFKKCLGGGGFSKLSWFVEGWFCLPLRNPRVGYSNLKRNVKYLNTSYSTVFNCPWFGVHHFQKEMPMWTCCPR